MTSLWPGSLVGQPILFRNKMGTSLFSAFLLRGSTSVISCLFHSLPKYYPKEGLLFKERISDWEQILSF